LPRVVEGGCHHLTGNQCGVYNVHGATGSVCKKVGKPRERMSAAKRVP